MCCKNTVWLHRKAHFTPAGHAITFWYKECIIHSEWSRSLPRCSRLILINQRLCHILPLFTSSDQQTQSRCISQRQMSAPSSQGQPQGPPSQGQNPILQSYQAWSERTSYITRVSTVFLCIMYILSFFLPLEYFLSNIPYFTIFRIQIFRLITSPIAGNSIFTLLLILITYPMMGTKMEVSMGSTAFLFTLMTLNLLVNIFFVLIALLCYLSGVSSALGWYCENFWIILFALITVDCMHTPDAPRRLLFIPVDIPSKYMPLALYGLIVLFSGFELAYALSIVVGFLYQRGHLDRLKPPSRYCEELENEGGWLRSLSRKPGYVLSGMLGHDSWVPTNAQAVDPQSRERLLGQSSSHGGGGFPQLGSASAPADPTGRAKDQVRHRPVSAPVRS